MKVVHIVPGSGGSFYCQNCMRDGELVRGMRAAGHDVVMVPMYLPPSLTDQTLTGDAPVFYGAVRVYLRQILGRGRPFPRWLARLLDAGPLLRLAAKRAGSTRAAGLFDMTRSVLLGPEGQQRDDLGRLIEWLVQEGTPDIVHLSNGLLLGLAGPLRDRLNARVVCSLQDEDQWVDHMADEQARSIWELMCDRAVDVDAFVAVSRTYGDRMRSRLRIPAEKLHVVYPGMDLTDRPRSALPMRPPVLGFLSRTAVSLGFGILVDAFIEARRRPGMRGVQLMVAGGSTGDDRRFLRFVHRALHKAGCAQAVTFTDDLTPAARARFLAQLTILSVPAPRGEAFGAYILEALAAGVPVVQPAVGAFPEIVRATAGGITYPHNNASALADAWQQLLAEPASLRHLGKKGRERVLRDFSIDRMVAETVAVYERVAEPKLCYE